MDKRKRKTLKSCKKTKTYKKNENIERVQNNQQKNDSKIKFDLWQIIIWNDSRIVTMMITKIPILHKNSSNETLSLELLLIAQEIIIKRYNQSLRLP